MKLQFTSSVCVFGSEISDEGNTELVLAVRLEHHIEPEHENAESEQQPQRNINRKHPKPRYAHEYPDGNAPDNGDDDARNTEEHRLHGVKSDEGIGFIGVEHQ